MIKTLATIATVFLYTTGSVYAKDINIDMLNKLGKEKMLYSTEIAKIDSGDTITWIPIDKGHNVEIIKGPKGVKLPKKSKINREYSYKFDTPGMYLYWCTPHKSMGMIGIVVVGDDISNKSSISKVRVLGKSKKKLKKLLGEI